MAAAHQAWYGSQPPPSFPLRQPYYETSAGPTRRRRRGCGFVHSVVRQFSLVIPVILVIVTGYVYGRDAVLGDTPAGDLAWVPLYLTIPLSAANIFWNLAAMANHRRAPHTGRPFPQQLHFLAELILTAGALVCFVFMVVILTGRGGALPLAYHQSLAWLLGMQMIASGFLCARAGLEIWRDRREREEAYTIH